MSEELSELEVEADANAAEQEEEVGEIATQRVVSEPSDPTIERLSKRIQRGEIDLNPDFQRKYVWDRAKATRLIESVLLRIPLPVIYLAEEGDKFSVIDGQQRLTSLNAFLIGSFPNGEEFKLGKMSTFHDYENKKFSELPRTVKSAIEDYPIRVITFLGNSDPELKFNVFERLNTGSVALNAQELRNCIYRGKYNELLKELAADSEFKSLLGLKGSEKRMTDVELVLRFAAFYHKTYLNYKSPIKAFLNEDMRRFRNIEDRDARELRDAFKNAVYLIKSLLGGDTTECQAFKRFYAGTEGNKNGYWEKQKFNASLFDILMWSFASKDKNLVMRNLDKIREAYLDLMVSDTDFIESIVRSTSSTLMVKRRFKKWSDRLDSVLENQTLQPRCFSRVLKEQLFYADPTCAICGQRISCIDDAAVDHIEQYWTGGQTIPENARLAHRYCNCHRPRTDGVTR